MGLNLNAGSAVAGAVDRLQNGMVDYGGGRGTPPSQSSAPRYRSDSPDLFDPAGADQWRGHGSGLPQDVYGDVGVRTRPRAEAAGTGATAVPGSTPPQATAAPAVAPVATKQAEALPDPVGNLMNRPSPVDELMGYTRMGSRTRPVSPTSGGPSGIPKGGS